MFIVCVDRRLPADRPPDRPGHDWVTCPMRTFETKMLSTYFPHLKVSSKGKQQVELWTDWDQNDNLLVQTTIWQLKFKQRQKKKKSNFCVSDLGVIIIIPQYNLVEKLNLTQHTPRHTKKPWSHVWFNVKFKLWPIWSWENSKEQDWMLQRKAWTLTED